MLTRKVKPVLFFTLTLKLRKITFIYNKNAKWGGTATQPNC